MENINIYDGCGIINFNETKIPYKKIDGMIVYIKCRENINGETTYSFLKGTYKPFDINSLK